MPANPSTWPWRPVRTSRSVNVRPSGRTSTPPKYPTRVTPCGPTCAAKAASAFQKHPRPNVAVSVNLCSTGREATEAGSTVADGDGAGVDAGFFAGRARERSGGGANGADAFAPGRITASSDGWFSSSSSAITPLRVAPPGCLGASASPVASASSPLPRRSAPRHNFCREAKHNATRGGAVPGHAL